MNWSVNNINKHADNSENLLFIHLIKRIKALKNTIRDDSQLRNVNSWQITLLTITATVRMNF